MDGWIDRRVIMFQEHISYALNDDSILLLLIFSQTTSSSSFYCLDDHFHRHHCYKSPESVALQNCPPFFALPSFSWLLLHFLCDQPLNYIYNFIKVYGARIRRKLTHSLGKLSITGTGQQLLLSALLNSFLRFDGRSALKETVANPGIHLIMMLCTWWINK